MQSAWTRFAEDPNDGPGWNAVSTYQSGNVLLGTNTTEPGSLLLSLSSTVLLGSLDLGSFGNRGDIPSRGVTLIEQAEIDYRCGMFDEIIDKIAGTSVGLDS